MEYTAHIKSDFAWRFGIAGWAATFLAAGVLCLLRPAARLTSSTFADARGATMKLPSMAQEGGDEEESDVPPEQVEKYIAVYKAMQRNHSLNVDQAAAAQGLSVAAFRDIEGRVERDDLIRERVRQALRGDAAGATPGQTPSPSK